MQGDVAQLARRVGDFGDDVARMSQDCCRKVEVVLFERDGLQVLLDSTASERSDLRNPLTAAQERLEQHSKRWAAGHFWI